MVFAMEARRLFINRGLFTQVGKVMENPMKKYHYYHHLPYDLNEFLSFAI